jgi:hypothetical protein
MRQAMKKYYRWIHESQSWHHWQRKAGVEIGVDQWHHTVVKEHIQNAHKSRHIERANIRLKQ